LQGESGWVETWLEQLNCTALLRRAAVNWKHFNVPFLRAVFTLASARKHKQQQQPIFRFESNSCGGAAAAAANCFVFLFFKFKRLQSFINNF
jgi:hypothetical protein